MLEDVVGQFVISRIVILVSMHGKLLITVWAINSDDGDDDDEEENDRWQRFF